MDGWMGMQYVVRWLLECVLARDLVLSYTFLTWSIIQIIKLALRTQIDIRIRH